MLNEISRMSKNFRMRISLSRIRNIFERDLGDYPFRFRQECAIKEETLAAVSLYRYKNNIRIKRAMLFSNVFVRLSKDFVEHDKLMKIMKQKAVI